MEMTKSLSVLVYILNIFINNIMYYIILDIIKSMDILFSKKITCSFLFFPTSLQEYETQMCGLFQNCDGK